MLKRSSWPLSQACTRVSTPLRLTEARDKRKKGIAFPCHTFQMKSVEQAFCGDGNKKRRRRYIDPPPIGLE